MSTDVIELKGNSSLTVRQEELIDLLLAGGRWRDALDQCGYGKDTGRSDILKSAKFRKELADRTESLIAFNGPAALAALEDALHDPTQPGTREKVKVATEFLDRMGLGKIERVKHEGEVINSLFILPPKDIDQDEY
jgi:hypothetical protein